MEPDAPSLMTVQIIPSPTEIQSMKGIKRKVLNTSKYVNNNKIKMQKPRLFSPSSTLPDLLLIYGGHFLYKSHTVLAQDLLVGKLQEFFK